MNIKFVPRHNTNPSDCWCDALALATGKPYDEIRTIMQPFNTRGGLIISTEGHVTYMRGATIYDNIPVGERVAYLARSADWVGVPAL